MLPEGITAKVMVASSKRRYKPCQESRVRAAKRAARIKANPEVLKHETQMKTEWKRRNRHTPKYKAQLLFDGAKKRHKEKWSEVFDLSKQEIQSVLAPIT